MYSDIAHLTGIGQERFRDFVKAVFKHEKANIILTDKLTQVQLNHIGVEVDYFLKVRKEDKNKIIHNAENIRITFWNVVSVDNKKKSWTMEPSHSTIYVTNDDLIKMFYKCIVNCDRICNACQKNNHKWCEVEECMCNLAQKETGQIIENHLED